MGRRPVRTPNFATRAIVAAHAGNGHRPHVARTGLVGRMIRKKPIPAPATATPGALSVRDVAALLTRAGGREITAASIRADIEAGAPANQDGTVNIVHYGAWLIKNAAEGDGGD